MVDLCEHHYLWLPRWSSLLTFCLTVSCLNSAFLHSLFIFFDKSLTIKLKILNKIEQNSNIFIIFHLKYPLEDRQNVGHKLQPIFVSIRFLAKPFFFFWQKSNTYCISICSFFFSLLLTCLYKITNYKTLTYSTSSNSFMILNICIKSPHTLWFKTCNSYYN